MASCAASPASPPLMSTHLMCVAVHVRPSPADPKAVAATSVHKALNKAAADKAVGSVVTIADTAPMFKCQLPGSDDVDDEGMLRIVNLERPAAAVEFALDRSIKNGADDDGDEPDNTEMVGGGAPKL